MCTINGPGCWSLFFGKRLFSGVVVLIVALPGVTQNAIAQMDFSGYKPVPPSPWPEVPRNIAERLRNNKKEAVEYLLWVLRRTAEIRENPRILSQVRAGIAPSPILPIDALPSHSVTQAELRAVELLGELRIEAAVPEMLTIIHLNTTFVMFRTEPMESDIVLALAKIGKPAIRAALEYLKHEDESSPRINNLVRFIVHVKGREGGAKVLRSMALREKNSTIKKRLLKAAALAKEVKYASP